MKKKRATAPPNNNVSTRPTTLCAPLAAVVEDVVSAADDAEVEVYENEPLAGPGRVDAPVEVEITDVEVKLEFETGGPSAMNEPMAHPAGPTLQFVSALVNSPPVQSVLQ